jgi:hypothetical protein
MKLKIATVVVLFCIMIGLAVHIEKTARPVKNVTVETQRGESHDH